MCSATLGLPRRTDQDLDKALNGRRNAEIGVPDSGSLGVVGGRLTTLNVNARRCSKNSVQSVVEVE